MQQRQLRLGDILDDYCPRERRLTNHAIVAMVGQDVKQTRCTTCDAEHEYKHAKVPRQRKKADTPAALYSQVAAAAPKRVQHEPTPPAGGQPEPVEPVAAPELTDPSDAIDSSAPMSELIVDAAVTASEREGGPAVEMEIEVEADGADLELEEGPVHRPLIRATLPRQEGQAPPTRPVPEFTIRQPSGRPNRFRPHSFRGGPFQGNRTNGNVAGPLRGGMPRAAGGGRPPQGALAPRPGRRRGKKRPK